MKDGQFHRIRGLPPHVFSEVNAMKAAARTAGHDIIDFGMGNPDVARPQPIVDKLIEAVRNSRTHRYSTSRGIPGRRRAQDYGAFTPIQVAAAALDHRDAFVAENRTRYWDRRDALIEGLRGIGWPVPPPAATMFVWAPSPAPYRALGSLESSKLLLRKARVAVSPGLGFGEYGEGFVRFALVENRQRIRQAMRNIKTFFGRSAPERARAVA